MVTWSAQLYMTKAMHCSSFVHDRLDLRVNDSSHHILIIVRRNWKPQGWPLAYWKTMQDARNTVMIIIDIEDRHPSFCEKRVRNLWATRIHKFAMLGILCASHSNGKYASHSSISFMEHRIPSNSAAVQHGMWIIIMWKTSVSGADNRWAYACSRWAHTLPLAYQRDECIYVMNEYAEQCTHITK